MLTTEEEEVEEAGDALAEEHDWLTTTGGVEVVCFAGLEGADVERSLIPLLLCFVVVIGKGEGDRLLLPLDEVDDAEDIFSTCVWVTGDSKLILLAGCSLFGIDDVEVADVTTTEVDVLGELVVDVLAGCKITNVAAPEVDADCIRGKL